MHCVESCELFCAWVLSPLLIQVSMQPHVYFYNFCFKSVPSMPCEYIVRHIINLTSIYRYFGSVIVSYIYICVLLFSLHHLYYHILSYIYIYLHHDIIYDMRFQVALVTIKVHPLQTINYLINHLIEHLIEHLTRVRCDQPLVQVFF